MAEDVTFSVKFWIGYEYGSIKSYITALNYYNKVDDKENIGLMHLYIYRSLLMLPINTYDNKELLAHLNKSIAIFKENNFTTRFIDANLSLGQQYLRNSKFDKAIVHFQKLIEFSIKNNNKLGEMAAVSNLGAAYTSINKFDKAITLGERALELTLELNKTMYLSSVYSSLSYLYIQKNNSSKAMEMIQQALRHQIKNNDLVNLPAKLASLSYILIQTFQLDKAREILEYSNKIWNITGRDNQKEIIYFYQGLIYTRQKNWKKAEQYLSKALQETIANNTDFNRPLMEAYLALSNCYTDNYIQAIEPAKKVFRNQENPLYSRAIAAMALTFAYSSMEKFNLAKKWADETDAIMDPLWLFENKLFKQFDLDVFINKGSIIESNVKYKIQGIELKIIVVTKNSKIDEDLYENLISYMSANLDK